jgi:hypothetical protein
LTKKTRRQIKPRQTKPHPFKIEAAVEEKTEDKLSEPEVRPVILPWLTVETLLYGLIFLLAVGLRVWKLEAYPLSDVEAQQSLLALALYRGDPLDAVAYSPLLVSLNGLAFLLFSSSDAAARLASVLLGSALVILPLTLRRHLGPRVCLLASALLATSPTAIYLSRTLNSEVGVAAGALMVVSGFFNWAWPGSVRAAQNRQQRWLLLLAGGLALMLTARPMVYSILIVFGLIVLLQFSTLKSLWVGQPEDSTDDARDLELIPSAQPTEPAISNPVSPSPTPNPHPHPPAPTSQSPELRNAGIFFLVTLVLLSTAALFNLTGLGVLTTSLPEWLSRFSFEPRPDAGFNAIFVLTIYEPLLVLAGLAGLAFVIVRRNLLTTIFSIWFVGLLLLDILMAGRPNSNVILPLVPLTFLAALALAELWQELEKYGTWQNEGLLLGVGLAIIGLGYIYLTGWLTRDCLFTIAWFCQHLPWLQFGLPIILLLLMFGIFWFTSGINATIRGTALVGVAVSLLATISLGWRLNYGPLMHLAYQPLSATPPSTELVALTETLTNESLQQVDSKNLLDVTLAGVTSPALRWQLRNYPHLQQANTTIDPPTTAIITPISTELGLEQAYLGQDFAVNVDWSPVGLRSKNLIKWLIYRRADERPNSQKVVLWLRVGEQ